MSKRAFVSTDQHRYCTAVWTEGTKAIEDNVPCCWVENNVVRFPFEPTEPLLSMIKKCYQPQKNWLSFNLVKIKRSSNSLKELNKLLNAGLPTEDEEPSNSEPVHVRKKKRSSDFIYDSTDLNEIDDETAMFCKDKDTGSNNKCNGILLEYPNEDETGNADEQDGIIIDMQSEKLSLQPQATAVNETASEYEEDEAQVTHEKVSLITSQFNHLSRGATAVTQVKNTMLLLPSQSATISEAELEDEEDEAHVTSQKLSSVISAKNKIVSKGTSTVNQAKNTMLSLPPQSATVNEALSEEEEDQAQVTSKEPSAIISAKNNNGSKGTSTVKQAKNTMLSLLPQSAAVNEALSEDEEDQAQVISQKLSSIPSAKNNNVSKDASTVKQTKNTMPSLPLQSAALIRAASQDDDDAQVTNTKVLSASQSVSFNNESEEEDHQTSTILIMQPKNSKLSSSVSLQTFAERGNVCVDAVLPVKQTKNAKVCDILFSTPVASKEGNLYSQRSCTNIKDLSDSSMARDNGSFLSKLSPVTSQPKSVNTSKDTTLFVKQAKNTMAVSSDLTGSSSKNGTLTTQVATKAGASSTQYIKNNAKVLPVTQANKGGRTTSAHNETYPLTEAIFQRRMLTSIEDMTQRVKALEKSNRKIIELLMAREDDENSEEFQATSTDDLLIIESKLSDDQSYVSKLKKHLRAVGLTCKDVRQHINNALDSLMTTEVQIKVNVVYGNDVHNKDYNDHLSFKYHLPHMFATLLLVISTVWTISEKEIRKYMSDWLKNASKRAKRANAHLTS